jgi:predicted acylesterase/phospholipase RssA
MTISWNQNILFMPAQQDLQVTDFTTAVTPILEFMNKYHGAHKMPEEGQDCKYIRRSPICLSDVVDVQGSQYVDLVQEGGGVHGIALAGYTYILEKMGVAFMKMAGTSAGSINTLLLSAVSTRSEMSLLKQFKADQSAAAEKWDRALQYDTTQLVVDDYYETRSEKLVEYLAAKDLRDLVDGHPKWQKLLLSLFRGKVDFTQLKKYLKSLGFFALLLIGSLTLLVCFAGVLSIRSIVTGPSTWMNWTVAIMSVIVVFAFIYIASQAWRIRLLHKYSERFGINPGEDFESWLKDILAKNAIKNVSHLKSKLQLERECLRPGYYPITTDAASLSEREKESPVGDSWTLSVHQLREEIDELVNLRKTLAHSIGDEQSRDQAGVINFKLIQLAKGIPHDAIDKDARAATLLKLFYSIIQVDNQLSDTRRPGTEEIKTIFDKELAMVCSDITNGIKVEFPAMHKMYWGEDYTISPACYARGSMSVPFFFKPFKITYHNSQLAIMEKEWRDLLNIDKRLEMGDSALLVDGGLLSNFPVNIFYSADNPVPAKPTIGIKLEFEDEAKSTKVTSLSALVGSMVSTMRYFYDRDFISKHNIFRKTVRSIDTGEVHWLNFALTEDDKIELFFRGALTAAIFLLKSTSGKNVGEAMQYLVNSGKTVRYKEKTLNIYASTDDCDFLTEDYSVEDISFNWEQYKRDRIIHLSETEALSNRLKRKASFGKVPTAPSDQA